MRYLMLTLTSLLCCGGAAALAQGPLSLEERVAKLSARDAQEKATPELVKALEANPEDVDSLLLLGMIREPEGWGNPVEAARTMSMYERAAAVLEGQRAQRSGDLALALELTARLHERFGRQAESRAASEKAEEIRRERIQRLVLAAGTPPQTAGETPRRIGTEVNPPRLLEKREPEYSEFARFVKVQGTVNLEIVVDSSGRPSAVKLVRGVGFGLDEKAAGAVLGWRFEPGKFQGAPVPVQAKVELSFRVL